MPNNIDSKYVGILVKPDTHQNNIFDQLVSDIETRGFRQAYTKDIFLSKADVIHLYPKETRIKTGEKALVDYLADQKSTIIIFTVVNLDIADPIKCLHELKGNKEKATGLRHKYNVIQVTDEDRQAKNSKYYNWIMINNFHVFDSNEHLEEFLDRKAISITNILNHHAT